MRVQRSPARIAPSGASFWIAYLQSGNPMASVGRAWLAPVEPIEPAPVEDDVEPVELPVPVVVPPAVPVVVPLRVPALSLAAAPPLMT